MCTRRLYREYLRPVTIEGRGFYDGEIQSTIILFLLFRIFFLYLFFSFDNVFSFLPGHKWNEVENTRSHGCKVLDHIFFPFLNASLQFCKRSCPADSVRPFIRPSVCPYFTEYHIWQNLSGAILSALLLALICSLKIDHDRSLTSPLNL